MTTVHDFLARWLELFNAGDLAALDDLYEPDSIVVPVPGYPVTGPDRTAALRHLRDLGVPMTAQLRHRYASGDIALLLVDWRLAGTAPDGRRIDMGGTATDIVRRGADGQWRYVVDNPSGTAELPGPR